MEFLPWNLHPKTPETSMMKVLEERLAVDFHCFRKRPHSDLNFGAQTYLPPVENSSFNFLIYQSKANDRSLSLFSLPRLPE